MGIKRQNNQLRLAFGEEGGVKLRRLLARGPKRSRGKRMIESPASNNEQLMEEVCERENCLQAYKASEVQQGQSGHRRHDGGCADCLLEGNTASHPRATAHRDLQAAAG